ncbi:hypothetical protein PUN28_002362 [Cardiocondyla obscurior]|uniref:Uncharacterized protein n=1 Tax=Cardiocondyla obscurior TaxID=286306 RepID=A0AAW2GTW6_9HYME
MGLESTKILIDKCNQREYSEPNPVTLFNENLICVARNRWRTDVAESSFDVQDATNVDLFTRIKGYPTGGNLC